MNHMTVDFKPAFHIIVTIISVAVNNSSDPNDLLERCTNDPRDCVLCVSIEIATIRIARDLLYSTDLLAIATIHHFD